MLHDEALSWLREAAQTTPGPQLLPLFATRFAAALQTQRPVGQSQREAARQLYGELDRLSREFATVQETRRWLRSAAWSHCLPEGRESEALNALLDQSQPLAEGDQYLVLRLLSAIPERGDLRLPVMRALAPSLECFLNSDPEAARRVLRLALFALTSLESWPLAVRQAAVSLCALNRGAEAVPYLRRADAAGVWPAEWRFLHAYTAAAEGRHPEAAALWEQWPADRSAAGPAEPGARLRCGLALIRLADPRADAALAGLEEIFGWIVREPLAIARLRSGAAREPAGPAASESLPQPWVADFWSAARLAATDADPSFRDAFTALLTHRDPAARRWTVALGRWQLDRRLDQHDWLMASWLVETLGQLEDPLLPAEQAVTLRLLAGEIPEAPPGGEGWLWGAAVGEDPQALLRGACIAVLVRSSDSEVLARTALEFFPPADPRRRIAELIAERSIEIASAEAMARWKRLAGSSPVWQRLVTRAAPRRQLRHLLSGDRDQLREAVRGEGWGPDRNLGRLALLLCGELKLLGNELRQPPESGDVRSNVIHFLCRLAVVHGSETAAEQAAARELPEARLPPDTSLPTGLATIGRCAANGPEAFAAAWAALIELDNQPVRASLIELLLGEPLEDPTKELAELLRTALLPAWVRGPYPGLMPFDESDLDRFTRTPEGPA